MKTSTQTSGFTNQFGLEQGLVLLCQAGYDALDFSVFGGEPMQVLEAQDWKNTCDRLLALVRAQGKCFNQMHTPFPTYQVGNSAEFNEKRMQQVQRCLAAAARLEIPVAIVHPGNFSMTDHQVLFEENVKMYRALQPYAKEYGVKIAVENMWRNNKTGNRIVPHICSTAQDFVDMMDALDAPEFVACLDLGHAGLVGEEAEDMIRALGHDRLHALHVHDNDHLSDEHTLPFFGKMDWEAILAALREIDYDGDLTLEADGFLAGKPKELYLAAATYMAQTAAYLRDRVIAK